MRAWRESASIIIAARNGLRSTPSKYDYSVLFLKRQKDANFAGAFVFPGGLIETADADLKWVELYRKYGFNEKSFKPLYPNVEKRPEIFRKVQNELPREISLRISAIRETFEESGILLCKKSSQPTASQVAAPLNIPDKELEYWQNKVHHNPEEFYDMCQEFDCYPNVWALYEWGNWLTPTVFPISMRFNAAFFFTGLPEIPKTKLENSEMEELLWSTPEDMMRTHLMSLLPPQQYELSMISKYEKLEDLLDHAIVKSKKGIQMFLGVKAILNDGMVMVFPGDSMYPENVDCYKKQIIDKSTMTIKQFRDISHKTNRVEILKNPKDNTCSVSCKL